MKKTRLLAGVLLAMILTLLNAACAFANTTETTAIHGHLDSIEGCAIAGWLWDSSLPEDSQFVTVTVTDHETEEIAAVVETEANEHREDLFEMGIGTGNYGFHVNVNWESLPESIYTVTLSCGEVVLDQTLTYSTNPESSNETLVHLGTFKTTAYCPCYKCSEGWGSLTSTGAIATANLTVAVDRRVIPMGSRLLINGQEYIAQDVGGGVKGNHIDIYFNTHGETRQHGVKNAEVYLIV